MQKTISLMVALLAGRWKVEAVGAGLLSLVLAMYMGLKQSVWFDEGYSILLAKSSLRDLIGFTSVDAHPPLYYLYLKSWGSLFGWSEMALRLSTAIFGAGAVVAMVVLCKRLFSAKIAIIVAPFLVLAPFLARYNFEIRMYAMVGFIGVIATLVLVTAEKTGSRKWWLLYAILVAVGMYTLYMSAVIWLAHVLWLAFKTHQSKRPILKQKFWLYYLVSVVLFLPWVPTVIYQLFHPVLPPYMTAVTVTELNGIASILLSYIVGWRIDPWLTLCLVAVSILIGSILYTIWPTLSRRYMSGLVLLLASFVTAIVFYAITSLPPIPPHFTDRYMVHVAIFGYALLGVIIAIAWRRKLYKRSGVLGLLAIGLMVNGLFTLHAAGNYNYQRLQAMQAKTIRQTIGCDQTTFVTAGPYGYIDMKYDLEGCDLRYYEPTHITFTGGYAPVNAIVERIDSSASINSRRIAFVYYDDSTVTFTPDQRFKKVGQQDFDKTHVVFYEQH